MPDPQPQPQGGVVPAPVAPPATPKAFHHAGISESTQVSPSRPAGATNIALEKKLGDQNRIAVPGPEASDADREAFFKALGRPASPGEYKLNSDEMLKELVGENTPINRPFVDGAFQT